MDPYNTADTMATRQTRETRSEYIANRELERARNIGRPLHFKVDYRRLRVRRVTFAQRVAGVLVWGVILFAVTGATAILMGY